MFYRDDQGAIQPVQTKADWLRRRTEILSGMQEAMGPMPERKRDHDFDLRIDHREQGNGFERLTVS
ncbi:MAG: hypothetical protein KDA78_19490, partial [Planctomycetaceae bacterium]|nr:hypothetical protein [Planctomycetaceae bacterium]